MQEFAQSPSVVIRGDRVRVYFCARPRRSADNTFVSYLSFFDLDRADLRRVVSVAKTPPLSLGDLGAFDEFGTNPISVIEAGPVMRVYFAGWTRCESVPVNGAIGVAESRDHGETFERLGPGPVIPYSPDEPFMMGSPRIRHFDGQWRLFYVAGKRWIRGASRPEPVYKIRMASSEDGIEWRKHGVDLIEDRLGDDECQACPDVIFRDGGFHMFFSYRTTENYRAREGGYRMGYAVSDDMTTWTRRDDLVGLSPSEAGWDSQMVSYPHVFALDGQVYMLYQGNEMGRTGLGLARLEEPSRPWSCA
jgi:hypothetical protein